MARNGARFRQALSIWLGLLLLVAALPALPHATVLAQAGFTIKVNTLVDEWSTDTATAPSSKCSLREALQATVTNNPQGNQGCGAPAIGNFQSYTIDLLPGTYVLSYNDQLPNISKKIVINGKGAVTINGGGQNGRQHGIFIVASGELNLQKLKLQYGQRPFGGAIWLKGSGSTRVTEVEFYHNMADNGSGNGDGGAVAVDLGEFVCVKSKFIENTARNAGGAVSSGGVSVLLDRCEFLRNRAGLNGGAYAAYGGSEVTHPIMRDVVFEQNWIYQITVPSTWPSQYAFTDDSSGGGAIYNKGYIELERVQFLKNYTDRSKGGGAIYNQGEIRMLDSAITDSKAKPGDKVPETLGGAILNDGLLIVRRSSIHGNEARYGGAIMNRLGGTLYLVNSTVAENLAQSGGGVSNGFEFPLNGGTQSNGGGTVHVYHSTLVHANDSSSESVSVMNIGNGYYYMANSITDSLCTGIVSSHGGNIFKTFCNRVPADFNNDQTSTDLILDNVGAIGLEGLSNNGGANLPKAEFLSVKVTSSSPALDLARDEWCTDPALVPLFLMDKDQIKGARLQGSKCDSGAIEVGSLPPQYFSQDAEGTGFIFPLTVFGIKFTSDHSFLLKNTGGGSFSWAISFPNNPDNVFSILEGPNSGALAKDQSVTIPLRCTPSQLGWYDGLMLVTTDIPGKETIQYPISCKMTTDVNNPNSWRSQPPGPLSAGQAAPGGQSSVQVNVGNQGANPMNATINWKDVAGDTLQFTATPGVQQVANATGSPQANVSVPPGGNLAITVTCTPTEPGLFVNTLQIATNDPVDPLLAYDISCEGAPPPDPEPLGPGSLVSLLPFEIMGMGISPDDKQLLAGYWGDPGVRLYNLSQSSGVPSYQTTFSVAGMETVTGIRYSSDGKYVYYTSHTGDGIVAASRDANGNLTFVQSRTTNTQYVCGVNPLKFCLYNSMDGARALDISPDDANLYVSGFNDDTLTVFSRNATNGTLLRTQYFTGTIDGQVLLNGPFGVLASPDGKNVYVAGRDSDTVVAFRRNPDNGRLTYLNHYKDEVAGVTALNGAVELASSPDGRFVYVASRLDDAVQIFARNLADGYLTPAGSVVVGNDPYHLLVSNDAEGSRLVVALYLGSEIKTYQRDRDSGALSAIDGQAALTPNQPVFLVSSADDRFVYASLFGGQGIQHLRSLRHAPLAQNLASASTTVGAGEFTLTVNGSRFYQDSVVVWNNTPLATSFESERRLTAVVPAALLASASTATVLVRTAQPGGGDSNQLAFVITPADAPPVPAIESVDPPAINLTGEPLSVTISGSGFTALSQALLNGVPVATTYLNPTTLLVELAAGDITAPGPLAWSVVNEQPASVVNIALVGDKAVPVKWTVAAANGPALPAISSFAPGSLGIDSGDQWLTVRGHNFLQRPEALSQGYWNGAPRETVVLDEQTLQMLLNAADLTVVGEQQVTVATPGAGVSDRQGIVVLAAGQNPVAQLDTAYSEVGASISIVVSGSAFVEGAQVLFNGLALPTSVVNGNVLVATTTLDALRGGGVIAVVNPGSSASNSLVFAPQPMTYLPLVRK